MPGSNNLRAVMYNTKEFHPGESKHRGFTNWSFGLRHFCVVGTLFAIIMGLLSTPYLEASFQIMMDKGSPSRLPSHIEKFPSVIDGGRSFQISEDGSEKRASPKKVSSVEELKELSQKQGKDSIGHEKTNLEKRSTIQETHVEEKSKRRLKLPEGKERQGTTKIPKSSAGGESTVLKETTVDLQESSPVKIIQRRSGSRAAVVLNSSSTSTGQCDLTAGKWIPEPAGPLYRFNQCRILSQPQNCQQNGRPDHEYEFYKWQPDQCTVNRFDANTFLELMRGKTLAFVGDSLARNQMESLMCILLQVADAKSKGSKNMHRWYFPSHKFTIIRMWSSWLVQTKGDFPPSLAPAEATKLNLTELDEYAYHLPKFDVTILSSGHWWLRRTAYFMNGEMLGGIGWPWLPSYGEKKMDHIEAFGIAMDTALRKIGAYPGYKGLTIFRTYTPDHYTGGSWDTGGSRTGETKPYEKAPANSFNEMMHGKQLVAFKNNTKKGEIMPNGSKLKMLDVYPVLNYRGDGHPGPFRSMDPLKRTTRDEKGRPPPQDCLHWCMPGPVDSMNELLFYMLKEELQPRELEDS